MDFFQDFSLSTRNYAGAARKSPRLIPLDLVLDDLLIDIGNKPPEETEDSSRKIIDSVKHYFNCAQ